MAMPSNVRRNKSTEELEWGELHQESFDFKHLTWNISNVFSLSNIVGYKVQSNVFSFAGATWRLRMYPYGNDYDSKGYIVLMITRLHSHIPEHLVFYKFCFKTCNEKEFESFSTQYLFDSVEEEEEDGVDFILKSKLKDKRNFLAPNGVLTILCEMRTKRIDGIAKCLQVEPVESFLVPAEKKSEENPRSSSSICEVSPEKKPKENPAETSSSSSISEGNDCLSQHPVTHHGYKILQDLKELFLQQEYCDVTINVKGQEFQAHKIILIARSPVFASTFRNEMKEKATGIINIKDCDPFCFSDFLCFLYSGNVEKLSVENVFSLFTVSDKYDVQDLRSECLEFIKKNLSVATFCDTITLALKYSEKELLKVTTDFFAKHWQEIIVTVKWQSFVIENPIQSNEIMIKALVLNKK